MWELGLKFRCHFQLHRSAARSRVVLVQRATCLGLGLGYDGPESQGGCVLAGINEWGECITGIATSNICELLQFG
jgi:hypothetical protein